MINIDKKVLIKIIKYEIKAWINSKALFYIASLFFFNAVVLSLVITHPIIFLINLTVISLMSLMISEFNPKHHKYLFISLKTYDFILLKFISCFCLLMLMMIFHPIFTILMNLETSQSLILLLCSMTALPLLSSLNTLISIIKIFKIKQYHFLMILLFPILMPLLLISYSLLNKFEFFILIVAIGIVLIKTLAILILSHFVMNLK